MVVRNFSAECRNCKNWTRWTWAARLDQGKCEVFGNKTEGDDTCDQFAQKNAPVAVDPERKQAAL
jgi:hypothetical protein